MALQDCEFPKMSFEDALALSIRFKKEDIGYNQKCKMFHGRCIADNHCPCLLNPYGSYFGWGECIHNEKAKG